MRICALMGSFGTNPIMVGKAKLPNQTTTIINQNLSLHAPSKPRGKPTLFNNNNS